MNGVFTLLKLDLKSKFSQSKFVKKSLSSFIINIIFTLIIYTVFIAGVYFITQIMTTGKVPLKYEFLVILSGVALLVQFVFCTAILVKNLYYDGDNELLLRFPVDGNQIFWSKAIMTFIANIIFSYVVIFPVLAMYGSLVGESAGFYFFCLAFLPLMSCLPFFTANLVALPVINLTNFLKSRFALVLSIMIIAVVFGFALYMLLLRGVLDYAQNKSENLLTADIQSTIRQIASSSVPFNLYGNVFFRNSNAWWSFLIIFFSTALLGAGAFFFAKKNVSRIVLDSIERESQAFEIKSKDKIRPLFFSLLRKEYLLIFRSLNYSFQYFAMALAAPVMVFFCNDLATAIGQSEVGGAIVPGLTMLVVIIFITIIVSFASTAISREGDTFYLTKIMPVSYHFQILVKLTMYFVVATASVLISCIIVGTVFSGAKYGYYVQFADIISIFSIAVLLIIALSCSAIRSDIKSPTFRVSKSGELAEANKNVSKNLMIGCFIAVVFGLATMIFAYVPLRINDVTIIRNTRGAYIVLSIIAVIYASYEAFMLFFRLPKKYNKIKIN
ncbi:MAG: hypothetical protein FWD49_05335 [Firmicutes bacterium]|nr:hypothetical protein [Bacillota bacterium]